MAAQAEVGSSDERRVEALGRRGRELAARIAALQAELVEVATELRGLDGHLSGATPRAWAAWQWGLTPAEAGRTFRLSERLGGLPRLRAELAAGRLSEQAVELLTGVATPENEAVVVEVAHQATGAQLVSLVRTMRRVQRGDRAARPAEERCSHGIGDDGLWHLSAALSPERGDGVAKALARERERLVDAARVDRAAGVPDDEAPWPTAADALAALGRTGLASAVRADGSLPQRFRTTVVVDADTVASELAAFAGADLPPDAVQAQLAERARLAGGGGVDGAAEGGAGGGAVVSGPRLAGAPRCELVGLGGIEPWLAAELTCQAALTVLVLERGRPVTLTEASRTATAAQRQALEVRDRTCRYPGCGATRDLHAHHIDLWTSGGPTELANLVLLCPKHHRVVHRWHLTVDLDPAGAVQFHRPSGQVIDPAPTRPPPDRSELPLDVHRDAAPGDRLTAEGADMILWSWNHPPGSSAA